MIQPNELKLNLPMQLCNGVITTTAKVWNILLASKNGDLNTVQKNADECPELIYAQYNYTPPIHFAVREGHTGLVKYLLANGAHDLAYRTYPFLDSLQSIAEDRGFYEIAALLNDYAADASLQKFKGDNGAINFNRTALQKEFERAVDEENIKKLKRYLHYILNLQQMKLIFGGKVF